MNYFSSNMYDLSRVLIKKKKRKQKKKKQKQVKPQVN